MGVLSIRDGKIKLLQPGWLLGGEPSLFRLQELLDLDGQDVLGEYSLG
jgi:hypothetical protein